MQKTSRVSMGLFVAVLLLPLRAHDDGSGLPLGHPFIQPEEPQRYYWSSTTYPFIPSTAWVVRIFQDGYQDRSVKADTNLVIAVRGGF